MARDANSHPDAPLTESDQISQFSNELDALIHRARFEYELCYATMVGCLVSKAHLLQHEAIELARKNPG